MNLMKNQIIQKFQSFEILEERAANKDSLFENFDKTIIFNRFKVFNFRCRSHVQEVSLPKNMFLLYIETHFEIFYISSYKPEYLYTIMYECENSPPSHELF